MEEGDGIPNVAELQGATISECLVTNPEEGWREVECFEGVASVECELANVFQCVGQRR